MYMFSLGIMLSPAQASHTDVSLTSQTTLERQILLRGKL